MIQHTVHYTHESTSSINGIVSIRHYKEKKKLAIETKHLKVITSFEEGNKVRLSRTGVGVGMFIMYL